MVIAVAGWFFGAQAVRGELFAHIHGLLGDEAAAGVQTIVLNARHAGSAGGIAAIISFACWRSAPRPPSRRSIPRSTSSGRSLARGSSSVIALVRVHG